MGGLECVITGLMDEFSGFFKNRKWPRERFTFAVIGISFCVALINVTPVIYNNTMLICIMYSKRLQCFTRTIFYASVCVCVCVFNLGRNLYASLIGHVCCWYITAVFRVIRMHSCIVVLW